ncbi:MAG TPA: glycosyltransferase [Burkholderiaceae bacterium]|nr:glycosyltransferase [Burkholderiaceae bacterium]
MAALPPAGRIHVLEVVGNAIVGGMERWVENLVSRLPRSHFAFTVLCAFDSAFADRLRALEVEVLIAPMSDDPPWTSVQMATALVASGGIDLLHAHLPNAHVLAGLAGRLSGKPVLATIHGWRVGTLDLEVHRAAGSHLSVVCRQSYFHALGLGVNAGQLSCDPNGVDTTVFQPRPAGSSGLRQALGLAPDVPLVGFVGRLSAEKGPEVFVQAALLLRGLGVQAHCVLIGEGAMEAALRRQISQLGLAGQVHLAGLHHDMPAVYNELDLLVSSSHSEAMPLAVMEAMASGLPVVATRVGGVPDLVAHGQTGWLVAPGDFSDLAARMAALLGDDARRLHMARLARQRAIERLNLADSIERMAALLSRLARPRARVSPVVSAVAGDNGARRPAARNGAGG